mgnify:CR=1 FL=1
MKQVRAVVTETVLVLTTVSVMMDILDLHVKLKEHVTVLVSHQSSHVSVTDRAFSMGFVHAMLATLEMIANTLVVLEYIVMLPLFAQVTETAHCQTIVYARKVIAETIVQ